MYRRSGCPKTDDLRHRLLLSPLHRVVGEGEDGLLHCFGWTGERRNLFLRRGSGIDSRIEKRDKNLPAGWNGMRCLLSRVQRRGSLGSRLREVRMCFVFGIGNVGMRYLRSQVMIDF